MGTSLFFKECEEEEDKRGIEDLKSVIIEKRRIDILQIKLFKIITDRWTYPEFIRKQP